jgi:hypothetical protein
VENARHAYAIFPKSSGEFEIGEKRMKERMREYAIVIGLCFALTFSMVNVLPKISMNSVPTDVVSIGMTQPEIVVHDRQLQEYPDNSYKLSRLTRQLWSRIYDTTEEDTLWSATLTDDGGFALVGNTYNAITETEDILVVRTNPHGYEAWRESYEFGELGTYVDEWGYGIVECQDGGFAIVGTAEMSVPHDRVIFLLRIDVHGNQLWFRTYGLDDCQGLSIIECYSGGFAIAGYSSMLFPPEHNSGGSIIRLNADGDILWAVEELGGEPLGSLIETQDMGFIGANRGGEMYRIDASGALLWMSHIPAQLGLSSLEQPALVACNDGGFAIAGTDGESAWLVRVLLDVTHNDEHPYVHWYETYQDFTPGIRISAAQSDDLGFCLSDGMTVLRSESSGVELWRADFDHAPSPLADAGVKVLYTADGGIAIGLTTDVMGPGTDMAMVKFLDSDMEGPAWIFTPTDMTIYYGTPFDYQVAATDPDGISEWTLNDMTNFDLSATYYPEGSTARITNIIALDLGTYPLELTVTDELDNSRTATFNIIVLDSSGDPDSMPPGWILEPTDQFIEYGANLDYQVPASDPSGIDGWTLSDTVNFAMVSTYYPGGSTVRITNSVNLNLGTYPLELTVWDPYSNTRSTTFTIIVQDTIAPVWSPVPRDMEVELGSSLHYTLYAEDNLAIDSWWVNDTTFFDIDSVGVLTNIASLPVKDFGLTVIVRDVSGNELSSIFKVIVCDTTSPEWVETPSDRTLYYSESLDYVLAATDLSGAEYWVLSDTENFALVETGASGQRRLISTTTLDPGVYGLTVSVGDPYGNIESAVLAVTVLEPRTVDLKLSGSFDFLLKEDIAPRFAALLTYVDTGAPISGGTVTLVVTGPDGSEILNGVMIEETLGSGVYVYEAPWTFKDQRLPKGIYLVSAQAIISPAETAVDMIQFHIDPPGESSLEWVPLAGVGGVTLAVAIAGIWIRRRK